MKQLILLSLVIITLHSCSPLVTSTIVRKSVVTDTTKLVKVLDQNDIVPANSVLLGQIKVGDTGFTTKGDYQTVVNTAKNEALKAGGNLIQIVKHQQPDAASLCHRIVVDVYKADLMVEIHKKDTVNVADNKLYTDSIAIVKGHFIYKNKEVSIYKLGFILQSDKEASALYKKVYKSFGFLNILSYGGGALIGTPVGIWLGGGKPNWSLAVVGCALVGISVPVSILTNQRLEDAVHTYNRSKRISQQNRYDLRLGFNQNGVGVTFGF